MTEGLFTRKQCHAVQFAPASDTVVRNDMADKLRATAGNDKQTSSQTQQPLPNRTSTDNIGDITQQFIREIDSLAETLPLATLAIKAARTDAREQFQSFFKLHTIQNEHEGRVSFTVPVDEALQFRALMRKIERSDAANVLVPRSFWVALVSQYDAFLGQLIQALLILRPEILNNSERSLSFSELVAFGTLEAARDDIIEKEVESVLRKSHSEQFDWLENKFDIKLRHDLTVWPTFVEITERRNLCVHTGAKVSAQYLQNCRSQKVNLDNTRLGQVLPISRTYFRKAYETIFEIGVKLAHVFWRKLKPDEQPLMRSLTQLHTNS